MEDRPSEHIQAGDVAALGGEDSMRPRYAMSTACGSVEDSRARPFTRAPTAQLPPQELRCTSHPACHCFDVVCHDLTRTSGTPGGLENGRVALTLLPNGAEPLHPQAHAPNTPFTPPVPISVAPSRPPAAPSMQAMGATGGHGVVPSSARGPVASGGTDADVGWSALHGGVLVGLRHLVAAWRGSPLHAGVVLPGWSPNQQVVSGVVLFLSLHRRTPVPPATRVNPLCLRQIGTIPADPVCHSLCGYATRPAPWFLGVLAWRHRKATPTNEVGTTQETSP